MRRIICEVVANVELAADKNYVLDEKGYVTFTLQAGTRRARGAYMLVHDCRKATVRTVRELLVAKSRKLRQLNKVLRNPAIVQVVESNFQGYRYCIVNLFDVVGPYQPKALFRVGTNFPKNKGMTRFYRNESFWSWESTEQCNWSGRLEQIVCTLTDPWHTVLYEQQSFLSTGSPTRTLFGVGSNVHAYSPSEPNTDLIIMGFLFDERY